MARWEVLGRRAAGAAWSTVGSVHAPDIEMALLLARDAFFRHGEGADLAVGRGRLHGSAEDPPSAADPAPDFSEFRVLGGGELLRFWTDKSYKLQRGYAGLGAERRRALARVRQAGAVIDRPRPPDRRQRRDSPAPAVRRPPAPPPIDWSDVEPHTGLLLALGDDDHILGHRHTAWTGVAPHLEEDLAFSSIAQDEIGHGLVWYGLAAERLGTDVDATGLGRQPDEYRHALLCEQPADDWAYTIARHLLYDLAKQVRLDTLAESSWAPLAEATGALRRELRYHRWHAEAWLQRLAASTVARERLIAALRRALPEAVALFETVPGEDALVTARVLPRSHRDQLAAWFDATADALDAAGIGDLVDRTLEPPSAGGRRGLHGPEFMIVWEEMTALYRSGVGER